MAECSENWTIEDLGFILYNNRSKNLVHRFIPNDIDIQRLIDIEDKFEWIKSIYKDLEKMVEIDTSLLNLSKNDDVIISKEDLESLSDEFKKFSGKFSNDEMDFLLNRKIPIDEIKKWGFFGLSNISDPDKLRIIGATTHPILTNILKDGINEGGIIQPLYENGILTNVSIRRITDIGKLKYTLAVPDVPVWGLSDINTSDDIWITEGLFDMVCLRSFGIMAVSPSSAVWSGIQLYKLLQKNPKSITIFVDNDMVGMKNGMILSKFFNLFGIKNKTVISNKFKDPCEHFWENNLGIEDISEIKITSDMVKSNSDNSFNFLKHLQNRKF